MFEVYTSPRLAVAPAIQVDAEVAWAGLVAAITGVAVAVVIYICNTCNARSFSACLHAVQNYWTSGC